LDFKTVSKPLADLKTWSSHRQQLAAYREGLGTPQARCAIVYIFSEFPEARVIEISEDDLQWGWDEFKCYLNSWCVTNKYAPALSAS
jgi:hypothetical protein